MNLQSRGVQLAEHIYLNGEKVSVDDQRASPYVEAEIKRQRQARQKAEGMRLELLTPEAASLLFGITLTAVGMARRNGNIYAPFVLDLSGRELHLISLESAMEYWYDKRRDDFDVALAEMRRNGHVMGFGWLGYNILHVRPVTRLDDVEAV